MPPSIQAHLIARRYTPKKQSLLFFIDMRRILSLCVVLTMAVGHAFAQWTNEGRDYLIHETFFLVNGDSEEDAGDTAIDE